LSIHKYITAWVRDLFWKEIAVTVKVNNVKVFSDSTLPKKGKRWT